MNVKEYQRLAARTLIDKPSKDHMEEIEKNIMVVWNATGLAGEAGEVNEIIKKWVFHRHPLDPEKLKKELGDVLWYVAGICTTMDFDMEQIMIDNIEKLRARYPEGFSYEDSRLKKDEK